MPTEEQREEWIKSYNEVRKDLEDDTPAKLLRIANMAMNILAGICADCTKIMPDQYYGRNDITRQEAWKRWAFEAAEKELTNAES